MKTKSLCLVLAAIFLCSCAPKTTDDPASAPTQQDSSAAETVSNAQTGATYTIELEENATTGYQWTYEMSADDIVALSSDSFENYDKTGELNGSGGVHTWQFTAVKPGDVTLTFKYARSWEKDVEPIDTKTYKLNVTEDLNIFVK